MISKVSPDSEFSEPYLSRVHPDVGCTASLLFHVSADQSAPEKKVYCSKNGVQNTRRAPVQNSFLLSSFSIADSHIHVINILQAMQNLLRSAGFFPDLSKYNNELHQILSWQHVEPHLGVTFFLASLHTAVLWTHILAFQVFFYVFFGVCINATF